MKKLKSKWSVFLIGVVFCTAQLGCGVRGEPQPPLTPAEIGHGQPSFKRLTGESDFSNVPSPETFSPSPTPDVSQESGRKATGSGVQ
jgi:hypothetical protein